MSGSQPAILRADWSAPADIVAYTTLRHGAGVSWPPFDSFNLGARCGDDAAVVARNRAELIRRFGLPSAPRWLRQVHGTCVHRFDGPEPDLHAQAAESAGASPGSRTVSAAEVGGGDNGAPEADAAVASTPGTVLAVLTADCLPVVFAAADGGEIAVAHAGWRGLGAGVLEATVAAMHTPADRLLAWLGPAAGPRAYEVGIDVFEAFVANDRRAASAFVATRPGHWHVDLYALARQRLADAGVVGVSGGGLCTISDPERFFSHRRDERTGRMATLAYSRR